jgi:hypothetical protein
MPGPLRTSFRSAPAFDKESVKAAGFLERGILVVLIDDERLSWLEREMLKQIGARLYGEPGGS